MSCKEEVTYQLFEYNFVPWLLGLIERSTKNSDVHIFCVDFGSALLANIFNNSSVLERLEKSPRQLSELISRLLSLLKENLPTTVLIHLLISLSYLSKERFG